MYACVQCCGIVLVSIQIWILPPTFSHVNKSEICFYFTTVPVYMVSASYCRCHSFEICFPRQFLVKLYLYSWLKFIYRSGSGSAGPGCGYRTGRMMLIRVDPDAQHRICVPINSFLFQFGEKGPVKAKPFGDK